MSTSLNFEELLLHFLKVGEGRMMTMSPRWGGYGGDLEELSRAGSKAHEHLPQFPVYLTEGGLALLYLGCP